MEITVTEVFLLVWCVVATFVANYYYQLTLVARRFTVRLIESPALYEEMRNAIKTLEEQVNANRL